MSFCVCCQTRNREAAPPKYRLEMHLSDLYNFLEPRISTRLQVLETLLN